MKEILFRGKRLDNGEWVYGGIRIVQARYYIIPEDSNPFGFEVDPATIGQYIGLQDKNGNKIFEGDIVSYAIITGGIEELKIPANVRHEVTFDENHAAYKFGYHYACTGTMSDVVEAKNIIVMGNRWDNPELVLKDILPKLADEIPTNVDDAVDKLSDRMSDEDKEYLIQNGPVSVHHSLGRWIRNEWGLWAGGPLHDHMVGLGITHPDDMSDYIITKLFEQLKSKNSYGTDDI